MQKSVLLADIHLPYPSLIYRYVKDYISLHTGSDRLDEIILLGDFWDNYHNSKHAKSPDIKYDIFGEIDMLREEIEYLARFAKKIVYLQGNHEDRNERLLSDVAPHLCNSPFYRGLDQVLELESIGAIWMPNNKKQYYPILGGNILARHIPASSGMGCASATLKREMLSTIFGHTHRHQSYYARNSLGEYQYSISSPCLCDPDSPVMQYIKGHEDWIEGFVEVYEIAGKLTPRVHTRSGDGIYINGDFYGQE